MGGGGLDVVETAYGQMASHRYTHATPTLFNAGCLKGQLSSCFVLPIKEDSLSGIYDTLKQCSTISKSSGGIGLSISNVRAKGSKIKGTGGLSNGIVPMLRVFDASSVYVDQGGGKRPGSIAVYLEPWHMDIEEFLDLKRKDGPENYRARNLFYALWIPDLFVQRVIDDADWTLFDPATAPGLDQCHSAEFEALYAQYEGSADVPKRVVRARDLLRKVFVAQSETGTPYLLFKDTCNRKSNHQMFGTIRSSNLCTEIIQYHDPDQIATCNLASINLVEMVNPETGFDFDLLRQVVSCAVKGLNRVIDVNNNILPQVETSNHLHRPIGLGVQGLSDVFQLLNIPWGNEEAMRLNNEIFEQLYLAACTTSMHLARKHGAHPSFPQTPTGTSGKLQFDLWGVKPNLVDQWAALKKDIAEHGMRNSLLVAPMPTASTAMLFGVSEGIDPRVSNVFHRNTKVGDFIQVNPVLVRDLRERGLWSREMYETIVSQWGSVQAIDVLPQHVKDVFRTAFEIHPRDIINLAAGRGPFVDQSMSMNLYVDNMNPEFMQSMFLYAHKKGLKTGVYYTHSQTKAKPTQFSLEKGGVQEEKRPRGEEDDDQDGPSKKLLCSIVNRSSCSMCEG